jgi:hypothetical protein
MIALALAACGGAPDEGIGATHDPLLAADASVPAAGCAASDGVCVPAGTCATVGGAVAPLGGCAFSDVAAECCTPPPPKHRPRTCADHGAVCAPVGGCLDAAGWFTPETRTTSCPELEVCCQPHVACGDATIDCCEGGAVFRPACDHGKQRCTIGHPARIGMCPGSR